MGAEGEGRKEGGGDSLEGERMGGGGREGEGRVKVGVEKVEGKEVETGWRGKREGEGEVEERERVEEM